MTISKNKCLKAKRDIKQFKYTKIIKHNNRKVGNCANKDSFSLFNNYFEVTVVALPLLVSKSIVSSSFSVLSKNDK